jgi:hypothetical protein
VITTLAGPCWALLLPDGQYSWLESIHQRHYKTSDEAGVSLAEIIETYGDSSDDHPRRGGRTIAETVRALRVVQLDEPCRILSCDACEEVYDREGEGYTVHLEGFDEDDLRQVIGDTVDDWTTDGVKHHCPGDDCPALTEEVTGA